MTKATEIAIGPTTDVLKFAPGFMLHIDVVFYNVESIFVFTSNFVAICSATSYPFGFTSISKRTPIDTLKRFVATLGNQDIKFSFIRVDEDGALGRSYEFMKTCHNMDIIVQTTGKDASSLNGKIRTLNNTLDNITRDLLMNSSPMKEIFSTVSQTNLLLST